MATELQTKLFKDNKQFSYLSELMAQQIYPRIVDALRRLGMEEVRLEAVEGWKHSCITLNGEILFFSLNTPDSAKKSIYKLDFKGQTQCPLFSKDTNSTVEEFESPFPKYKSFCEIVINKLLELEKNFEDANELILRIENMGVRLQRNVMTEKNGKKN